MNDNMQLDVNKVLQKLQAKLAEAMTSNAILEAKAEQLQERLAEVESANTPDGE